MASGVSRIEPRMRPDCSGELLQECERYAFARREAIASSNGRGDWNALTYFTSH